MLEIMKQVDEDVTFKNYTEGYHMLSRDLQAEHVFNDSYEWIMKGNDEASSFKSMMLKKDEPVSYCGKS